MERISSDESRRHLIEEHQHRYQLAAQIAFGDVLDAACGIGYGAAILRESEKINSYLGIDNSVADVETATREFAADNVAFQAGDVSNIEVEDARFDTVVSLETVEHVLKPAAVVGEFKRVMKDDGLLIISVPTRCFDEVCEDVYGPNEFHLHRFSENELRNLVSQQFEFVSIYLASFGLGTSIWNLDNGGEAERGNAAQPLSDNSSRPMGSFVVVASMSEARMAEAKFNCQFYQGQSLVEYDSEAVAPLRALIEKQDKIVTKKEEFLKDASERYALKESEVQEILQRNEELAEAYQNAGRMIKDRQAAINHLEGLVNEREERLSRVNALNRGLEGAVSETEQKLRERNEEVEHLKSKLEILERDFKELQQAISQQKIA